MIPRRPKPVLLLAALGLTAVGCAGPVATETGRGGIESTGRTSEPVAGMLAAALDEHADGPIAESAPPEYGVIVATIEAADTDPLRLTVDPVSWQIGIWDDSELMPITNARQDRYTLLLSPEAVVVVRCSEAGSRIRIPGHYSLGVLTGEDFAAEYLADESLRADLAAVGARLFLRDGRISSVVTNYAP